MLLILTSTFLPSCRKRLTGATVTHSRTVKGWKTRSKSLVEDDLAGDDAASERSQPIFGDIEGAQRTRTSFDGRRRGRPLNKEAREHALLLLGDLRKRRSRSIHAVPRRYEHDTTYISLLLLLGVLLRLDASLLILLLRLGGALLLALLALRLLLSLLLSLDAGFLLRSAQSCNRQQAISTASQPDRAIDSDAPRAP